MLLLARVFFVVAAILVVLGVLSLVGIHVIGTTVGLLVGALICAVLGIGCQYIAGHGTSL